MDRNTKLIAYTLFALAFPIWIFLGKMTEGSTKPFAVSIDPKNLEKIDSIARTFNRTDRPGNNDALANTLTQLGQSNTRTNENLGRLANIIENYIKNQQPNTDGKVPITIPSDFSVTLRNTSGTSASNNSPNPINIKDSITDRLSDLRRQAAAVVTDSSPETVLTEIINIDPNEKSINQELSLSRYCCDSEKQSFLSMLAELDRLAREVRRKVISDTKGANSDSAILLTTIRNDSSSIANRLKSLETACSRVLVFGIRNVSGAPINISVDENSKSKFTFVGKNQIFSTNQVKDSSALANNDVAYFQIKSPCTGKQSTGFYNFRLDFNRPRNVIGSRPDIGYLNLKLGK